MAFRWRTDGGPLIVLFVSTHPSSTKNKQQKPKNKKKKQKNLKLDPLWQNVLDLRMMRVN